MSVVGHVFVNAPSLEIIARRISSFCGPMARRDDGVLCAVARAVFVMANNGISIDTRRYASVVLIHEGTTKSEVADNTMIVFRLVCDAGDVGVLATLDVDHHTLATFEPGIRG